MEIGNVLGRALDAHGGLRRWRELQRVTAHTAIGGATWTKKGWPDVLADVQVSVDPHEQWVCYQPFTSSDRRGIFSRDRVAMEQLDGSLLEERQNPRAAFAGHRPETAWDALHLLYFSGYAMWTYLTVPFVLAEPGFVTEELGPWTENGETWQRLRATFPSWIVSHSTEQIFYFGPDGLLRRHDYTVDVIANATTAHYTAAYCDSGGIIFPTRRRALLRRTDGTSAAQPVLVSIDLDQIQVE